MSQKAPATITVPIGTKDATSLPCEVTSEGECRAGLTNRRNTLQLIAGTAVAFAVPSLLADRFLRDVAGAIDEPSRRALSIAFRRGHCAPSIMEALVRSGDPRVTPLLKLVAGLPGGIANQGAECGGLTAAAVYLGLTLGGDDGAAVQSVVDVGRLYARRFEARHGTTECRVLQADMRHCLQAITSSPGLVNQCTAAARPAPNQRSVDATPYGPVLAHMRQADFHCAHDLFVALEDAVGVDVLTLQASCGFLGEHSCSEKPAAPSLRASWRLGRGSGRLRTAGSESWS